jgi:hypothetical protein
LDLPLRQTPLLPDKPVLTDPTFDLEQLQLQAGLPSGTTPVTRLRP